MEQIGAFDDFAAVVNSHFTTLERKFIFDHDPADRHRAFLRCWTRKEAYLKGVGKGLTIARSSFDTLIAPGQPVGVLPDMPDSPEAAWCLADVTVPGGYIAAVAVEASIELSDGDPPVAPH